MIFIVDLIDGSVVPFVAMFFLSLSTFVGVLRAHRRIRSSALSQVQQHGSNRTLIRDLRFGATMLVLNVAFFVCMVFWRLNYCLSLNPFDDIFANRVFTTILGDLFVYYYFLNFFIQLAVNNLVRKEVWSLFKKNFSFFTRILC